MDPLLLDGKEGRGRGKGKRKREGEVRTGVEEKGVVGGVGKGRKREVVVGMVFQWWWYGWRKEEERIQ